MMLKASQGRTAEYDAPFSDPEFEYNIAAVSRLFHEGLYAGAYHYLCARTVAEAKAEADYFIALVREAPLQGTPLGGGRRGGRRFSPAG